MLKSRIMMHFKHIWHFIFTHIIHITCNTRNQQIVSSNSKNKTNLETNIFPNLHTKDQYQFNKISYQNIVKKHKNRQILSVKHILLLSILRCKTLTKVPKKHIEHTRIFRYFNKRFWSQKRCN
jgi:hypothetical protein